MSFVLILKFFSKKIRCEILRTRHQAVISDDGFNEGPLKGSIVRPPVRFQVLACNGAEIELHFLCSLATDRYQRDDTLSTVKSTTIPMF